MPSSHEQAREKLLHAVLARAASDSKFRSGLLTDPKQTIIDAFGIAIPDHFRLRFIEKAEDLDALIVLPELRPNAELSEGELDTVHGGAFDLAWDPGSW